MTESQNDKIAKKLKIYFQEQNITQQAIAERFNISQSAVNRMLNGKSFGKKQANKWGEAFGLNPFWLITGEGEMLSNYPLPTINDQTLQENKSNPLSSKSVDGLIAICLNLQQDNIFLKDQIKRNNFFIDDLNIKLARRITEVEIKNAEIEELKAKVRQLEDEIKIRDAMIRGKDTIIESKLGAKRSISQKGEKIG